MAELTTFIERALTAGKSRDEIRSALLEAKWTDDEISDGFSDFADVKFPVPVPRPKKGGWAKESFLYLLMFLMLYTATISLGNLLSGFVDTKFPDAVKGYEYGDDDFRHEAVRWLLASLIVSFPMWFFLTRQLLVSLTTQPERRLSPVRAWLTYLTLFNAAGCVLSSVIVLFAGFLGGELAVRTILKCSIVVVLAASVFGFYYWDLHRSEMGNASKPTPWLKMGAIVVWVVNLGVIIGGFGFAGGPIQARMESADEKRVQDLTALSSAVRDYYTNHKALPASQDKAFGTVGRPANPYQDPETKQAYGYHVVDKTHFELSATFQTDQSAAKTGRYGGPIGAFDRHHIGLDKFVLNAKGQGE